MFLSIRDCFKKQEDADDDDDEESNNNKNEKREVNSFDSEVKRKSPSSRYPGYEDVDANFILLSVHEQKKSVKFEPDEVRDRLQLAIEHDAYRFSREIWWFMLY